MRRFLTLLCLLGLAVPAGVVFSGCTRNPAAKYCPVTSGYGILNTAVYSIVLQPQVAGISLAYGQTQQLQSPAAYTCLKTSASVSSKSYSYGTSNRQLVDISPTGAICAGTWNRNTGGGIADYTYCNYPNPLPSTNGLPYGIAYISASADSVDSNEVAVYVHAPITSINLVGPASCLSQGQVAQLDALAYYYSSGGSQSPLCEPTASAQITAFSVASNVVTLTAANSFIGGEVVGFSGLGVATFLNNQTLTILSSGLSGSQFQVAFSTSDVATTADTGVATTSLPSCRNSIGTMAFNVGTGSVASINSSTNQITAEHPGTTAITASISGSGSSAGYFSTCPPQSISVTLANGSTTGSIAQGTPQNLVTSVLDTNGNIITGLSLTYQSTNPIDISASSAGSISASFPGTASINAICQPGTCNPAPINEIGLNGTGLSISSNPVSIDVPGTASEYAWFSSPGQSQYIVPIELLSGTVGSTIRLPYVPNSMIMDRGGVGLYLGSPRELMVFSPAAGTLTKQDPTAPGVVLAVAPNDAQLLINDQARQVFYLYNAATGISTTFGGMGASAAWTPDSQTLYIVDNSQLNTPSNCSTPLIKGHSDTLYVYNANTGWTVEPLPPSPLPPSAIPSCSTEPNTTLPLTVQTPAITVPGIGAYLRGIPTVAHTWCPSGTVGNNASIQLYPQGDSEPVQSDVLAATVDGQHILSAELTGSGGITLNDIAVTIPTIKNNGVLTPIACPTTTDQSTGVQTLNPLTIVSTYTQSNFTGVDASEVNQVVVGSIPQVTASQTIASNLAFITYSPSSSASTTSNATLPYYIPGANGAAGSLNYAPLMDCTACGTITAPLVGVFSPDNTIFFVSTAGDNEIHYISINSSVNATTAPTDTQQISPNLPACLPVASGGVDAGCTNPNPGATYVPVTAIAVKPRAVT